MKAKDTPSAKQLSTKHVLYSIVGVIGTAAIGAAVEEWYPDAWKRQRPEPQGPSTASTVIVVFSGPGPAQPTTPIAPTEKTRPPTDSSPKTHQPSPAAPQLPQGPSQLVPADAPPYASMSTSSGPLPLPTPKCSGSVRLEAPTRNLRILVNGIQTGLTARAGIASVLKLNQWLRTGPNQVHIRHQEVNPQASRFFAQVTDGFDQVRGIPFTCDEFRMPESCSHGLTLTLDCP